jgi:hypothetical protein
MLANGSQIEIDRGGHGGPVARRHGGRGSIPRPPPLHSGFQRKSGVGGLCLEKIEIDQSNRELTHKFYVKTL